MIRQIHNIMEESTDMIRELGLGFLSDGSLPGDFLIEEFIPAWDRLITSQCGSIHIWEHEGKILGGFGGVIFPSPTDGKLQAAEMFWYVHRDHRSHISGARLFFEFEKWAIGRGARRITVTHLEASMPQKLKKFYESHGYSMVETNYLKKVA